MRRVRHCVLADSLLTAGLLVHLPLAANAAGGDPPFVGVLAEDGLLESR